MANDTTGKPAKLPFEARLERFIKRAPVKPGVSKPQPPRPGRKTPASTPDQ